jgi:hypothetical protein
MSGRERPAGREMKETAMTLEMYMEQAPQALSPEMEAYWAAYEAGTRQVKVQMLRAFLAGKY